MLLHDARTARAFAAGNPGISALRRRWFVAVALLVAPLAAGCGDDSGRISVSGDVTLDGAPLDSGSILFTSVGDGPLVSSGAMIQDGAYVVPEAHGLLPGTYLVQISSADDEATPSMAGGAPGMQGIPIAPDRIPEEYNMKSDKQVEVTRDGDNAFDFNIVSKPAR